VPDARVSRRVSRASDRLMPASEPAVASKPAQNALPISALITGAIGRKKPIAMQARQVRMRKTAFAMTSTTTTRLLAAMRRLAYQRSAKATIAATIRIERSPCFEAGLASHCKRMRGAGLAHSRRGFGDSSRGRSASITAGQAAGGCGGSSLSWVLRSKSLASWRSCSWLARSPLVLFTIRPRFTAGRAAIASAQRKTCL
jgi:hypothetical protein